MSAGSYRERPAVLPGVVVWRNGPHPAATTARILPDGCMDLIWDGTRLFIAGPDTRARRHASGAGTAYVGLRFSRGLGPALLGVRADELRDKSCDLADVWSGRDARILGGQVAADPVGALQRWLAMRADDRRPDRLAGVVFDLASGDAGVAEMAERLGMSTRQLHRRCVPLFGYGPQHLARVLRFGRAVARARQGMPLAEVAVASGFADQPHLSREVRDLAGTTPARLVDELAGPS